LDSIVVHREIREIGEAFPLITGRSARSERFFLSSQGDQGDRSGFFSHHRESSEIGDGSILK
jgi:hypothetical protein